MDGCRRKRVRPAACSRVEARRQCSARHLAVHHVVRLFRARSTHLFVGCPARDARVSAVTGKSGVERHAAVNEQRRAGDVIAFIGDEPQRGVIDIFALADASVWNQRGQTLKRFGVSHAARLIGVGSRQARCRSREFCAARPPARAISPSSECAFRRRIVHMSGPRNRFVDELMRMILPAALECERGPRRRNSRTARLCREKLAREVGIENALPFIERHVDKRVCPSAPRNSRRRYRPFRNGRGMHQKAHPPVQRPTHPLLQQCAAPPQSRSLRRALRQILHSSGSSGQSKRPHSRAPLQHQNRSPNLRSKHCDLTGELSAGRFCMMDSCGCNVAPATYGTQRVVRAGGL